MKKFTIEIECDNAAFGECESDCAMELANILTDLVKNHIGVEALLRPNNAQWIRDSNGNRVGTFKFEDRERIRQGK